MNQADEPKIIFLEEDRTVYFADKSNFEKPMVDRPEYNGETLSAREALGACLGFAILKT